MGIFGKSKKDKEIDRLINTNKKLSRDNLSKDREINRLEKLNDEKDSWMDAVASDALRNGSPLGGKILAEKKKFLNEQDRK